MRVLSIRKAKIAYPNLFRLSLVHGFSGSPHDAVCICLVTFLLVYSVTQRWPEAIPNVNNEVNTVTLDRQVSAYLYRGVNLNQLDDENFNLLDAENFNLLDAENFNLLGAFHFIFAFYLTLTYK